MTITIEANSQTGAAWDFRQPARITGLPGAWTVPATLMARETMFADLLAFEVPVPAPATARLSLNGVIRSVSPLGVWAIVGVNGQVMTYAEWIGRMLD